MKIEIHYLFLFLMAVLLGVTEGQREGPIDITQHDDGGDPYPSIYAEVDIFAGDVCDGKGDKIKLIGSGSYRCYRLFGRHSLRVIQKRECEIRAYWGDRCTGRNYKLPPADFGCHSTPLAAMEIKCKGA